MTAAHTPTSYDTASFKEVVSRLDCLWADKMEEIEGLTEVRTWEPTFNLKRRHCECVFTGSLEESGVSSGKNKENYEDR
jgi:hypothetical protein